MRYATVRRAGTTAAAVLQGEELLLLDAPDVGAALRAGIGSVARTGEAVPVADAQLAPVITSPRKVICLGLNYRSHILEVTGGAPLPPYPTLFPKWADTLTGPYDDIPVPDPALADAVDWEAELAVVVGRPLHRADAQQAQAAIGGYTVANDISMRGWQLRTDQWMPGKAWDATTPLGPYLVTGDDIDHAAALEITCEVNGVRRQTGNTSDLLFGPAAALSYISTFTRLHPGDVVLTGTTGGVGIASGATTLLVAGDVVRTEIEGIGVLENRIVAEAGDRGPRA